MLKFSIGFFCFVKMYKRQFLRKIHIDSKMLSIYVRVIGET